jgi:bacteriorhodopsin
MDAYSKRGNTALAVDDGIGGKADLEITVRGSDFYWAVMAIMGFSTLVFMGLAFTKPRSHRLFHYITAAITCVACIAYYSMAANLGQTPIQAEFIRPGDSHTRAAGTREIFYVRYIDWFVTTPLLLLDLLLTAGLPWPSILIAILADEIMIITGLVGALTRTRYKWGYYAFGNAAFLYVIYMLVFVGLKHAKALGTNCHRTFLMCGVLTSVVWFLYPIAWGVSEGANLIHPDSEAVFYGVLDLIAKPVFGALLIYGHRNIDPGHLGLHIHDYEEVAARTKGNHPATDSKVANDYGTPAHGTDGVANNSSV